MSMEIHVLLSAVPDVAAWQQAITASGFEIVLDPTLKTASNTGFVPVKFAGQESGFEFDIFPASDITETYPEFAANFGDRGLSANFRWGGDLTEMSCALAASAALAKLSDGIYFDPQQGACFSGDEAIIKAKADIALAAKHTRRRPAR